MSNLLKKHKYKLLALMLSIVSIFTLFFGINKTYAYETNQFTYTIDTTNYTFTTINNINGVNTDINNSFFQVKLDNSLNETLDVSYTLLLNCYFVQNGGFITRNNAYISAYNSNSTELARVRYTNLNFSNDNMLTIVLPLHTLATTTLNNNYINILNFDNITNYTIFIVNIDLIKNTDIGLQQYYDTYYGQIEENYNALLSDYNDLQDNYDTLDANYNSLQNSYDTLQSNYNQLNGNINNLNDFYKYGFLSLIKNGYNDNNNVQGSYLDISYVNRSTNVVNSIDYPITLNDISSYFGNSTLSLYDLVNYYKGVFDTNINSNNDYYIYSIDLNLYFQSSYGIDYLDFTNYDFNYEMELFIRDNVNNYSLYLNDLDNANTHINSELILQKNSNLKMFDYIGFTYIVYNSDTLRPYISLNNVSSAYYQSGFDNGYVSGIQQGRDSQQSTINNLNEQVNSLTNHVNELEQENQYQYNSGYQNGLNVGASQNLETNGMKTLFNSILSYPVNMIKSVFDFEFMGINISSLIMFIISIGIVAFVIKKFL